MLLNEIQASFVSLCFFALRFFISNSITFRFSLSLTDVTPIIRRSNFFGSIYNIQKETKCKTWNIASSHSEVFCKIGFITLLPQNKCFENIENTCEPADFLGKNWKTCNFTIAELFHRKISNICVSNIKERKDYYRRTSANENVKQKCCHFCFTFSFTEFANEI